MRWPILVILLFLGSQEGQAFHILVHGTITDHTSGEGLRGVQVMLVKDSIERETINSTSNGRYELYLERGYTYEIHYKRQDLVRKFVVIDAREIPLFPDVPFFEMDIQMTMFAHIDGFDLSAFDKPVGRAVYKHSVRNLSWDLEYTNMRKQELARVMIHYERELEVRRRSAKADEGNIRRKRKLVHF